MKAEEQARPQLYCVYNQTNECFLSLGATLGDKPFARFGRWLGYGRKRTDEGCWVRPQELRSALGFLSRRDLVYLDSDDRVVHVVEAFPALRTAPARGNASSFLALPPRTIASSQTRPGHQLLICAAGEMQSRLRRLREVQSTPVAEPIPVPAAAVDNARRGPRVAAPPVAYFAEGGKLAAHTIRDLSAQGLFLVTRDRWPIGEEVRMCLQPSGAVHHPPITVSMRVTRWGADGVGLEFTGSAADTGDVKSLYVC